MTEEFSVGSLPPPDLKPKRKVSYNQDVVLCPDCKKRIRLNNNGRARVHVAGKAGSEKCIGSNALYETLPDHISESIGDFLENPSTGVVYKGRNKLFSDSQ